MLSPNISPLIPDEEVLRTIESTLSLRSSPCFFGSSGFCALSSSVNSEKRCVRMAAQRERSEVDRKAKEGETVVPGGTGGKSLEAYENLAEGRRRGGSKGGQTRKEQLGTEGYEEMGRKGGLSTKQQSGGERAKEEGIEIDESKFKTQQANE